MTTERFLEILEKTIAECGENKESCWIHIKLSPKGFVDIVNKEIRLE
ncbi:MAG: hypothetical protein ACRCU6_06775 [Fusobacteriaceae bacterium]